MWSTWHFDVGPSFSVGYDEWTFVISISSYHLFMINNYQPFPTHHTFFVLVLFSYCQKLFSRRDKASLKYDFDVMWHFNFCWNIYHFIQTIKPFDLNSNIIFRVINHINYRCKPYLHKLRSINVNKWKNILLQK